MLLKLLKPKFWFSAHLHVKFNAEYRHSDRVVNPDEILLDETSETSDDSSLENIMSGLANILELGAMAPLEYYLHDIWVEFLHIVFLLKRNL